MCLIASVLACLGTIWSTSVLGSSFPVRKGRGSNGYIVHWAGNSGENGNAGAGKAGKGSYRARNGGI